jgi:hypothetical protein
MRLVHIPTLVLLVLFVEISRIAFHPVELSFANKTFHEIQSRVVSRDPECGAIVFVREKGIEYPFDVGLRFSIREEAKHAIVVLGYWNKLGFQTREMYRLPLDTPLRQELRNQKRLKQLEVERPAKVIAELSGGQLAYGMTMAEVVRIKGEPEYPFYVKQRGEEIYYGSLILSFMGGRLVRARERVRPIQLLR